MRKLLLALLISFCLLASFPFLAAAETEHGKVCAYYFYGNGCKFCKLADPKIDELSAKYNWLSVQKYEVWYNDIGRALLLNLFEQYDIDASKSGVPIVFVGDKYFEGPNAINSGLEQEILKHKELACPALKGATEEPEIPKITFLALLGAAAVDAINPCELAVLTLLLVTISLSITEARKKRKVLFAGLAFTIAVYISYLLIGFGIFGLLSAVAGTFTFILKKILGVVALIIGIFNIKDFVKHGALGFKTEVPESWRPKMKALIRSVTSVPGAFAVGLLVSLFLLPCTSGPYLVILGMLASYSTFWQAVPLLLLYNLIFVLPMLAITFLVHFGIKAERVQNWRLERVRYLHLLAGTIMVVLGVLLLAGII